MSQPKNKDALKLHLLSAIVDNSNDAIISKDLNGIITSWNLAAERIFGYKENEMIGRPIITLIPPDKLSEEQIIINHIKSGRRVEHYETIRLRKDKQLIHVSITISPIKDDQGVIIGASKIARDITEKIQIQKKLEEQTKLLKELNSAKDEFIGIASHELKTPITTLKAYFQLLERSLSDERHKDYANRILIYINKLNTLVSDLLDVSKIQAGKLQMNITSFDFSQVVEDSIEATLHIHPNIEIKRSYDQKPMIIEGDPERLEQVINNLFSNAIKYSPSSEKITIDLKEKNKQIVFSVTDYGIGISNENAHNIFNRFYRVKGLARQFTGLGIGLSICQEIIHRHHGKIWVESELNQGSTFCFALPLRQSFSDQNF